jgi:hypothetical protein
VVVITLVTTSYRNMESAGKSYPLIFGIVVRSILTRTMSLESASTVQFEQLIWQIPIWGQSGADTK